MFGAGLRIAAAQTLQLTVGTGPGDVATLADAIMQANSYTAGPVEISIDAADFANNTLAVSDQMIIGLASANTGGLTIQGNGATIDMQGFDRAFFIASGTVTIANLTIANGRAQGGDGADSGGGGLGGGGAIFVANPTVVTSGVANDNLTLPTAVTLRNVAFLNNQANGGAGAAYSVAGQGGGGGMGGNGGNGFFYDPGDFDYNLHGGGGGGGFGDSAEGGAAEGVGIVDGGSPGDFEFWFPTDPAAGGSGGPGGGNGGMAGGGGGASNPADFLDALAGGGGGVNGSPGTDVVPSGGFGGGGGGGGLQTDGGIGAAGPGNGGFGGGGGGGNTASGSIGGIESGESSGSTGGFGGGGGGSVENVNDGPGGFAAGSGVSPQALGGGGAGLGGAVFVMAGATVSIVQDDSGGTAQFQGNAVNPGSAPTGGNAGSAYGADLFLGANATIDVATTLSMNSLGGAGNLNDPNVQRNQNDPNAQGGLTKSGVGTLVLTGTSTYAGPTVVASGTLHLAAGAKEQGTSSITVGQAADATLFLDTNSEINSNSPTATITLGAAPGVKGTLLVGNGGGGPGVGFQTINATGGTGLIVFQQAAPLNQATGVYPFFPTITGAISVVQSGPGTTRLAPTAQNTYSGGTTITSGTLQLGSADALPQQGEVALSAGTLDLNGVSAASGALTISGGQLVSTQAGGNLSPAAVTISEGTIGATLSGSGNLTKTGAGNAFIVAPLSLTGAAAVQAGTLELGVPGALGSATSLAVGANATVRLSANNALGLASAVSVSLAGRMIVSPGVQSLSLGATTVAASGAVLDLSGDEELAFTFGGLNLAGGLAVWNWSAAPDSSTQLLAPNGIASGSASQIRFYSDQGQTLLGHGQLDGTVITVVPEPGVVCLLALAAAVVGGTALRRRRS